ncbi:MAG TPA: NBR1-Ig-like domain-containing protein [Anaerolineaceae bacterium]|nr:NBR1-Ig-like domain-containing protein [Anaerolineaceae bacterium]
MKKIIPLASLVLVMALLLSACNLPRGTAAPTAGPTEPAATIVARTVSALLTQSAQLTPQPTATLPAAGQPTPVEPATAVPSPAVTQIPTLAPTAAVPTITPTPQICDRGSFVSETIPDDTSYLPGTSFVKTWRLKNNGTCTWSTAYSFVFVSGDAMGATTAIPLPASVAPGATVDLTVTLTAPATPNTYRGEWMLQNASGVRFGLGDKADKKFWVQIIVTAPMFAVTSIGMSANPASYTGVCPVTVTFTGSMTASAPGTVTYYWERSDGAKSATQSLTFTAAGTQNVTYTWQLGANTSGWVKIYVDQPNHQYFAPVNFTVNCP